MFSAHTFAIPDTNCSFNIVSTDEVNALIKKHGIPVKREQVAHVDKMCELMEKDNALIYFNPKSVSIENKTLTGMVALVIDADLFKDKIILAGSDYNQYLSVSKRSNQAVKQISSTTNQVKSTKATVVLLNTPNKNVILNQVAEAIVDLSSSRIDSLNTVREKLRNFDRKAFVVPKPQSQECSLTAYIANPNLKRFIATEGFAFSKYHEVCEAYRVNNVKPFLFDMVTREDNHLYTNMIMLHSLDEYASQGIPVYMTNTRYDFTMSNPGVTSENAKIEFLYDNVMNAFESQNLEDRMKEVQTTRQRLAKVKFK